MAKSSYELMLFKALKNGQSELRSTYDIWLSIGNVGTPQDFLESLRGYSAYETWLSLGNTGSEEDFLASLGGLSDNKTLADAKAYTDQKFAALGDQVTFTLQGNTLIITPVTQ